MRSILRNTMPSMFHRRLVLLAAAGFVVLGVLGVATASLTTGQRSRDARAEAEAKLKSTSKVATKRGAITDRNGLPLAVDEPGWELAVHFDLLTGEWAYQRAREDARADKFAWSEMNDAQREQAIASLQNEYDQQLDAMFQTLAELTRVSTEEMRDRRTRVVKRVHEVQIDRWQAWQRKESEERGEPVPLEEVVQPIAEQFEHHVLVSDIDDAMRLRLENFIAEGKRAQRAEDSPSRTALPWSHVELRRTTVRQYPFDTMTVELDRSTLPSPMASDAPVQVEVHGVGLHLIGMMRDVWREDVRAKPLNTDDGRYDLAGYQTGDRIGRSGIEQAYERQLRGSRGLRTINLQTREIDHEVPPRAGQDVMLAIDIRLQAQVQAIMSPRFGLMQVQPWHLRTDDPREMIGMPLNGSAVVMDIASGDVLAAVSMPEAPRSLLETDPDLLWNDPVNEPMLNRAVARPYQPGSTLKPFVLAAAVSDGLLGEHELINTPGYLWPDKPTVFRDWYYKTYNAVRGEIDGVTAIEVSSNPFFGILAKDRMIPQRGLDRLPWWFEQFGLGQKPGTGLPEEVSGFLGAAGRELENNEVCFMTIGQGPVAWTPLQAAMAYTRLASGDMNRQARLVVWSDPGRHPRRRNATISPAAQRMVFEGMRRGANTNDGTTHHITDASTGMNREPIFNVQGATVMAKSGTADPGNYRWIDFNRNGAVDDGELEAAPRDHAWVVALVQPDGAPRPTHVVVCVVEYAGSGGRVAGPIVNQIIHALQRQGYLDWPPAR